MKNLKNLGKALTKAEQKTINGGKKHCTIHAQCPSGQCCGYHTSVCGPQNNNTGYCDGRDDAFGPGPGPIEFLPMP